MKLSISADETASPVIDKVNAKIATMGAPGPGKIDQLVASLKVLGLKSDDVFAKMVDDAKAAFAQIKGSGVASFEEIGRAEQALAKRMDQIHKESAGSFGAAMDKNVVKAEGFFAKMKGGLERIRENWMGLSLAGVGAVEAVRFAWEAANKAAAFQQQRDSLDSLAAQYGTTAGIMLERIKELSGGLLNLRDAASGAANGLKLGLNPDQIYAMAAAAEKLNRTTGTGVPEAFKKMVEAVALGRERALETEIGLIDLNARFGEQAKKMSEAEKAAGRLVIVEEKLGLLHAELGEGTQSIDDKIQHFKVTLSDLGIVLGQVVIRAFYGAVSVVRSVAVAADVAALAVVDLGRATLWLVPGFDQAKKNMAAFADEIKARMKDSARAHHDALGVMIDGLQDAKGKFSAAAASARTLAAAMEQNRREITSSVEALKPVLEAWRSQFEKARSAHGAALTAIEKRQREHSTTMKAIADAMKSGNEALAGLAPEKREGEAWLEEKNRLQLLYNDALGKEGVERAKALKDYIEQRQKFTAGISDEVLGIEQQIGPMQAFYQIALTGDEARLAAINDIKAAQAALGAMAFAQEAANASLAARQQENLAALSAQMEAARLSVKNYQFELAFLEEQLAKNHEIRLDATAAVAEAQRIRAAIGEIPDVSYKTVIIEYKTKASPVRPFSEGMDDIRRRMESLPTEGGYTVKAGGLSGAQASRGGAAGGASFTAHVTVNAGGSGGTGASLGKEIDRTLADLWQSKRSRLRAAMEAA